MFNVHFHPTLARKVAIALINEQGDFNLYVTYIKDKSNYKMGKVCSISCLSRLTLHATFVPTVGVGVEKTLE